MLGTYKFKVNEVHTNSYLSHYMSRPRLPPLYVPLALVTSNNLQLYNYYLYIYIN